uniref:Chemokine interleukin-8-like domain-containing protein n=1 Tax=Myripristis murdjan TaxID=586833 RepID=A0A667Z829_9TELE
MVSCGNLLKSVLVAVVLVTLAGSESTESKLKSCCEEVSSEEITEPIIGYQLQRRNLPCVPAVIFQTETGYYCTYVGAPWVMAKIEELKIIFSPNSLFFILSRGKLEASARATSESPSDQTDQ